MKLKIALLFSLFCGASALLAQQWQTVPITDFVTIEVPGTLEIREADGEVIMYTEDANGIYAIVPTDLMELAPEPLNEDEIGELFDGMLQGALARSQGELINREAFTREGIRGEDLQILIDSVHPYYGSDRFIRNMYHNRFVLNLSYTPTNQAGNQRSRIRDKFFNSVTFAESHTFLEEGQSNEVNNESTGYQIGYAIGRFAGMALPILVLLAGLIILFVFLIRRKSGKNTTPVTQDSTPAKKPMVASEEKTCSKCGKVNSSIAKYCAECGFSL